MKWKHCKISISIPSPSLNKPVSLAISKTLKTSSFFFNVVLYIFGYIFFYYIHIILFKILFYFFFPFFNVLNSVKHLNFAASASSLIKTTHHHKRNKRGSLMAAQKYFFDYNTVELVLLGCAIVVCASGIMFTTGQFTEDR